MPQRTIQQNILDLEMGLREWIYQEREIMTPILDKILTARVHQILDAPQFALFASSRVFSAFAPAALDLAPDELAIFVNQHYQNPNTELKAIIKLAKITRDRAREQEGIDVQFANRDLENIGIQP